MRSWAVGFRVLEQFVTSSDTAEVSPRSHRFRHNFICLKHFGDSRGTSGSYVDDGAWIGAAPTYFT